MRLIFFCPDSRRQIHFREESLARITQNIWSVISRRFFGAAGIFHTWIMSNLTLEN